MRAHRVRALLMGGQACVFYGAAEFSRDTDFAILASVANLARLKAALADLQADLIAVPSFDIAYWRSRRALRAARFHDGAWHNPDHEWWAGIRVDRSANQSQRD